MGSLRLAQVTSRTQSCRRTPGLARRDDDVYLQVGLLARGAAQISQDGREAILAPGQFAVYETDRPFLWRLRDDWELLVFTWPRSVVSLPQGRSPDLTARSLGGPGLGGIVSQVLRDLAMAPPELSSEGAAQLAVEVVDLVLTTAGEVVRPQTAGPGEDARLRQVRAWIAANLDDPDLDPAAVAAAHHLSVRQLHRLFAAGGDTVARHIRVSRLDRAWHDLADPAKAHLTVTQIARRWGFVDLPGFSRAFTAAYGTPPRDHRRHALGR
jgi:AraC-like DNA-binding protein